MTKYHITIKSKKMTQEVANEIFQAIVPKQIVRLFSFHEGYLSYHTERLIDISEILEAYGFNDEEDKIEVKDEFEYAYENMMTPEETTKKEIENVINNIQRFEDRDIKISDELKDIKNVLSNIIREK